MRPMTRRRTLRIAFALAVVAGALLVARPYVHGLSFVIRAADLPGLARRAADLDARAVRERELEIPHAGGLLRARAYEPSTGVRRTALLVPGLHPAGIDEPRVVALARELAASGVAAVTPAIPELSQFAITPAITDAIEQSALWLAAQGAFAPDGRVGLMGISFSGGLAVVASGRPALRDRVAYVLAVGGHADLPRVLRYLCTGIEPVPASEVRLRADAPGPGGRAETPPPHDYGVAVILLGVAERVVPRGQVAALRDAVRRFLWASHLHRVDRPAADREFAALRDLAPTMPEPSATLLEYVTRRDVVHLGARLLPFVGTIGDAPSLSAERSPKPSAPVFLLHGADDNVIPAAESQHLADYLRGETRVRVLLSRLISHADADRPARAADVLALAAFWGDLLAR